MNRETGPTVPTHWMRQTDSGGKRRRRNLFYGLVTLLIAGSFLAEILRGDCPVP